MNNKQVACVVLSMILAALAYGTLTMKNKATAAKDETKQASDKAEQAANTRKTAQAGLDRMDRETRGLRDYLDEWQANLQMTSETGTAERLIDTKLKQGKLVIFRQSIESVKLSTTSTIPNALRARLVFEDDYHKLLNWVGSLESSVPTSRVSTCKISKGQKGNEVKMELNVEVPLSAATAKR